MGHTAHSYYKYYRTYNIHYIIKIKIANNAIILYTMSYLLSQDIPSALSVNPSLQLQKNEPVVLVHSCSHPPLSVEHSSISEQDFTNNVIIKINVVNNATLYLTYHHRTFHQH